MFDNPLTEVQKLIIKLVLIGVFCLSLVALGWVLHGWKDAKDRLAEEQAAREEERELVELGASAEQKQIEDLRKQKEQSDANAEKWRLAVEKSKHELAACSINADILRVLNDAQREAAAVSSSPVQPSSGADSARSNCEAELGICRRNYVEVCRPNAEQLNNLSDFYRNLEKKVNGLDPR